MTTLLQRDNVEEELGKSIVQMDEYQLLPYCQERYKAQFKTALPVESARDRAILRTLLKVYGSGVGGYIIKWIFEKHSGCFTSGDRFTFTRLSHRWRTDEVYEEMLPVLMRELEEREGQAQKISNYEVW